MDGLTKEEKLMHKHRQRLAKAQADSEAMNLKIYLTGKKRSSITKPINRPKSNANDDN